MKKLLLVSAAFGLIIGTSGMFTGQAMAAGETAFTTAVVGATVVKPITISATGGAMEFGTYAVDVAATASSVVLSPANVLGTPTNLTKIKGATTNAIFTVGATTGATFSLSLTPAVVQLDGANLTVDTLTVLADGTGITGAASPYTMGAETGTLTVGGTLKVAANYAPTNANAKTGTLTATVAYN